MSEEANTFSFSTSFLIFPYSPTVGKMDGWIHYDLLREEIEWIALNFKKA